MSRKGRIRRTELGRVVARATTDRRIVLSVIAGLTGLATTLLPYLRIETDVSRLLPEKNSVTQLFRALDGRTKSSRALMVEVFGDNLSERLPSLVERLRASEFFERIDATKAEFLGDRLDRYRASPLWFLPPSSLEALEERLMNGREAAIERSRVRLAEDPVGGQEVVLADPLDLRTLLSDAGRSLLSDRFSAGTPYLLFKDGRSALLRVVGHRSPFDTPFTRALLRDLRNRTEGFELRLVGSYARVEGDADRIGRDILASAGASFLLVGAFLLFAFRRGADVLAVLVPVVLALYWTMPIGGALLGALTPLTISSAAILMGLGVDFSIHYLSRYRDARTSMDHRAAVEDTLRVVGRPMVTALATTALAFLSFVLAEFDGLRVFGWLLALGLLLSFVSCLFVTPQLAAWSRGPSTLRVRSSVVGWLDGVRLSRAGPYLSASLVAVGLLGFGLAALLGVRFSTDSRHLRPYDDVSWRAERSLEARLGHALSPLELVFPADARPADVRLGFARLGSTIAFSDRPDLSFVSPEQAQRVRLFRKRVEGWVSLTLADLERAGFVQEPFRPGLERLAKRLESDLEAEPGLGRVESVLGKPGVVVRAWLKNGIHEVDRWPPLLAFLQESFPSEPEVSHVYALLNEMQEVLGRDLRKAGLTTGLVAVVLLAVLCGGLRPGLVAAVPAFATLGVMLGVMSVAELPLNMSNCVAVPLLLGIGVDAGIHLVAELRHSPPSDALDSETRTAAVAVWRTSATTALAFGSLAFATVPGISSLGVLMMIGVTTSFVSSLWLLPAAWHRLSTGLRP